MSIASLETLMKNSDETTFLDTNIFIFEDPRTGQGFINSLLNIPMPVTSDFLYSFNYLRKEYVPFLKEISKTENFLLTDKVVDELRQTINLLTISIHIHSNRLKCSSFLTKEGEKKERIKRSGLIRRGRATGRIHVRNRKNLQSQLILAFKNYRRVLSKIVSSFEINGKVLADQEFDQKIYNLIYKPIEDYSCVLEKDKRILKKIKKASGELKEEDEKQSKSEDIKLKTDEHLLATALYYSGATANPTRIITKDKDLYKLLRRAYKRIYRNLNYGLNYSKFGSMATSVYLLCKEYGEDLVQLIALSWKRNKKGKILEAILPLATSPH